LSNKKLKRLSPNNGGKFKGPYKSPDFCLRNWLSHKYKEKVGKVASKGGFWD
jgi:hypothetical protein